MKVLINASNLHVGGGVQVAASFIDELYQLALDDIVDTKNFSILMSDAVSKNIRKDFNSNIFRSCNVYNVNGIKRPSSDVMDIFNSNDVVFTVFGPLYFSIKAKYVLTGFAQAWICYPETKANIKFGLVRKLVNRVSFLIKRYYFSKSTHLIVEQEHVRDALVDIGFLREEIFVVSNTLSSVFTEKSRWRNIDYDFSPLKGIKFGFVGRPYSHKNLDILPSVNDILTNYYNIQCSFVFTLDSKEMESLGFDKIANFYSVGSIDIEQCPSFYQNIDALIFPSLLECFSITPVEAMYMNKLVFASDYNFVKEVCGDFAFYFDPLEPKDIASVIANNMDFFSDYSNFNGVREDNIKKIPSAKKRAEMYLNIIEELSKHV